MWYFGVLLVIQKFALQVTGGLLPPSTGVKWMPGTAGVSQTRILSLSASCNPHDLCSIVSQARPNQPQHRLLSDAESDPHWGWLGLACKNNYQYTFVGSTCMHGNDSALHFYFKLYLAYVYKITDKLFHRKML